VDRATVARQLIVLPAVGRIGLVAIGESFRLEKRVTGIIPDELLELPANGQA